MQVHQSGGSVDVMRMAALGGDPAVERLADLTDCNQFVDPSVPQRAEQVLPWWRQRECQGPKRIRNAGPTIHMLTVFAAIRTPPMPIRAEGETTELYLGILAYWLKPTSINGLGE